MRARQPHTRRRAARPFARRVFFSVGAPPCHACAAPTGKRVGTLTWAAPRRGRLAAVGITQLYLNSQNAATVRVDAVSGGKANLARLSNEVDKLEGILYHYRSG